MERLYSFLIGYAFGLLQTAYIYGKIHGIDIRQHGSGNAGTTNTLRVFGTRAGLIVLAGDIAKCMVALAIVTALFKGSHPETVCLLKMYAAAGVILAHDFPFYMNFKGGKGIAATAGLILSFHPTFIPVGVILFFGTFLTTHYVSLGSLLVYAGFVIQLIISGQMGILGAMTQAQLMEMYIIGIALAALAYYQHRANIVRLWKHEERKTYLFKRNKE